MKHIESLLVDVANAIDDGDLEPVDRRLLSELVDQALRHLHSLQRRNEPADEAYERAAARARSNDFADTGGKDWT